MNVRVESIVILSSWLFGWRRNGNEYLFKSNKREHVLYMKRNYDWFYILNIAYNSFLFFIGVRLLTQIGAGNKIHQFLLRQTKLGNALPEANLKFEVLSRRWTEEKQSMGSAGAESEMYTRKAFH